MSGTFLYEGKTKIVELSEDGQSVILTFKDDITAGDGAKHDVLTSKGQFCSETTARLMHYLNTKGVYTMFINYIPPNKIRARKLKMIPLEVIVRFKKAGSFVRRYGGTEGEDLPEALVEFTYKSDAMHDPLMCVEHLEVLGILDRENAVKIINQAKQAANFLKEFFSLHGFELWDIKFEYGFDEAGNICLGDEISPDTMRLRKAGEIFDKDIYRRDLGNPMEKYEVVLNLCRSILL
ncbi:phosphoribosylaminoimidazole-succinocarboxamide synthase [Fervidobacterium changbaicum]|uniref:Phosphoribosylaminoimidazole-succinocarboxamide synthase n=2 Tax=Fervidobacterium TaxID=2422 RepID=A0AAI8GDG6_FERIS|nr:MULTISPECIES: phosphoribosylaminoimidazolesuccinocarboxamide synthase [Fervidobacterium]AMW33001.1 phosphoribosylaminoimidazolesuccinocarboxamide synthase [Fervidobacterium islandicum]QAV33043.1 phosphoribosylaminoimidazolesuccinocarboxamide synthase [Fervidobacterium changbaicum]SDH02274.1 phosphoribosylaminoimidazole-succinocarboxamide synthase [Fervidobacterium changbaicum]